MLIRRVATFIAVLLITSTCSRKTDTPSSHPELKTNEGLEINFDDHNSGDAKNKIGGLPWEVIGDQGESFLPNAYYAEESETEQIMPMSMMNGRLQIDRLIYPTLGNPHLYVKDSPSRLIFVLRVEQENLYRLGLDHFVPTAKPAFESPANLEKWAQALKFYLVPRDKRSLDELKSPVSLNDGAYELKPAEIQVDAIFPSMPEKFKKRRTIRVYFDKPAMERIPEGLYDTRFEATRSSADRLESNLILDNKTHFEVFEFQYNAVRIFKSGPEKINNQYTVLNVSDTQGSIGSAFKNKTLERLRQFVSYVNYAVRTGNDKHVGQAAFITFNGDLHNGGSPGSIYSEIVAKTYNEEAKKIVGLLKELDLPIFLTVGNHDGYASTGVVPKFISDEEEAGFARALLRPTMSKVVEAALSSGKSTWPKKDVREYNDWASRSTSKKKFRKDPNYVPPGGLHLNIMSGAHTRFSPDVNSLSLDQIWSQSWKSVPLENRNVILYDGFYQWQRTYGPLNYSWVFGQNHFVSLNSFELRQHRRTGWGMYIVNYGGGVSQVQMKWLEQDLDRAENNTQDTILLAHHDPRGGHNGEDFPYYFQQLEFAGIDQSFKNYIREDRILPELCAKVPTPERGEKLQSDCLHDGLQEWMRADSEFDCEENLLIPGDTQYHCVLPSTDDPAASQAHPWYSGFKLVGLISGTLADSRGPHSNLRTIILGHTHYNSMQMIQEGDLLIPTHEMTDAETLRRLDILEMQDPLRNMSTLDHPTSSGLPSVEYNAPAVKESNEAFMINLNTYNIERTLTGSPGTKRELAVLRVTSNADLTNQMYIGNGNGQNAQAMFGFTVFDLWSTNDSRNYQLPQINAVTWYRNTNNDFFQAAGKTALLSRTVRYAPQNYVHRHPTHPEYDMIEGNEALKRFYLK